MATKRIESQFTNATALATAVDLLKTPSTIADLDTAVFADLIAKLDHMAQVASKPSKKASGPTKSQVMNLNTARKVAEFIWACEDEMITSKTIVTTAGIPEVVTTQKATAVLGIAADNGWVVRKEIKSRVYWGKGDVNPTE